MVVAAACLMLLGGYSWPEAPADESVRKAEATLEAGDFESALAQALNAVSLAPKGYKAYGLKASALNRLGKFQDAEDAAAESLKLKFDNPAAHENLAFARLNLGKYKECIDSATNAINFNASSAVAYALRASAYEQLNLEAQKLSDIKTAAALNPAQYSGHLLAAQKGEKIFAPSAKAGKPVPKWAGFLALALGAVFGVGLLAWMKKPLSPEAPTDAGKAAQRGEEAPGDLLAGKYRMDRPIGRGGMGQVWEGWDVSLNRPVAIKQALAGDASAEFALQREFCLKEARAVAQVRHPNIADIYDVLDLPGGVFLVFEFVKGKTLQHILVEKKRLPLDEAKRILGPACSALEFAHERRIIHRDIKPANIMLTEQGFVRIMDFGIARSIGTAAPSQAASPSPASPETLMAHTQTVAGTPAYMALEAMEGIVSPALDVYSLGVCLYEMLTGGLPFGSSPGLSQKVDKAYVKPSVLVPGLPAGVDALVDRALEPRYQARIQSAVEFSALLKAIP